VKESNGHKVFSGALQFTIFIGVIIALLLTGLVLLQNTHTFFIQQSKATIENVQLANSGISFLKKQDNFIADTTIVNQLSNINQKVEVQSSSWGIYEKAIVKSTHREKIFYKCALLGTQIESNKRPNLYLQDNFKPLVIVGNTILKGNIYLPSQGVKLGYIAGESYYGVNLLSGHSYISNSSLPDLKLNYKEVLERFVTFQPSNQDYYLGQNELKKFNNSFLKPTKFFIDRNAIVLDNIELTGNIVIRSEVKIQVKKTAKLRDAILIAPIIEIDDGVTGNFQAFVDKSIYIGKECKLSYPSSIVLLEKDNKRVGLDNLGNSILIDENSEIKGTIIYFKDAFKTEDNFKTQIKINAGVIVKGEVYCQGNLELLGKVVGSLYTEQFIVNKSGSIFINHIYNGQIIDDNFPELFCGLLFKNNKKGVAKWLY